MGTMIHAAPLSSETRLPGLRELSARSSNVTRPDVMLGHPSANTWRRAPTSSKPIPSAEPVWPWRTTNWTTDAYELNLAAARHRAPGRRGVLHRPPSPASWPAPWGQPTKTSALPAAATFPQIRRRAIYEQAKGLIEGGADFLLIETCFDTGSLKAGTGGRGAIARGPGTAHPGDRLGDHRADRHHARWPAHRRALRVDRQSRSAGRRA